MTRPKWIRRRLNQLEKQIKEKNLSAEDREKAEREFAKLSYYLLEA